MLINYMEVGGARAGEGVKNCAIIESISGGRFRVQPSTLLGVALAY